MADQNNGYELSITRLIAAPVAIVYRVWTERLEEWWAPKPWTTRIIEQDLRAGGRTAMVMSGPDGETSPIEGVFLEVTPNRRIVSTDAFRVGWIPQPPFMIGFFEFAAENDPPRHPAGARHWDPEALRQHEAMGFHRGWSQVAEQLAALAEAEAAGGSAARGT